MWKNIVIVVFAAAFLSTVMSCASTQSKLTSVSLLSPEKKIAKVKKLDGDTVAFENGAGRLLPESGFIVGYVVEDSIEVRSGEFIHSRAQAFVPVDSVLELWVKGEHYAGQGSTLNMVVLLTLGVATIVVVGLTWSYGF